MLLQQNRKAYVGTLEKNYKMDYAVPRKIQTELNWYITIDELFHIVFVII